MIGSLTDRDLAHLESRARSSTIGRTVGAIMRYPEPSSRNGDKFDHQQAAESANGATLRVLGDFTTFAVTSRRLDERRADSAPFQFGFADTIGEEAELADADQASGQHMQQETAQELDRIERHELPAGRWRSPSIRS